MLKNLIHGIHHVTAGVAGAQEDVDFFTSIVGQRLAKQTVLMDGPLPIYHLYYTNADAEIGSAMTTFPYGKAGIKAKRGSGQVKTTSYTVPTGSLPFWVNHFNQNNIEHGEIEERFGLNRLTFQHPCGLEFEFVEDDADTRKGYVTDEVSINEAVKGFHSVTMSVREVEEQDRFIREVLGYEFTGREGQYYQYELNGGGANKTLYVIHEPDLPQGSWGLGAGTIHHVAFAVDTDKELNEVRELVTGLGYTDMSEIKDRYYFHSSYVRSPGGILCEFTTSDIGFTIDEPFEELGQTLHLPPWKQNDREEILSQLEPVRNPQKPLVK
ncbi:ring-cleaving dioxygenase [Mesobacillus maritimus]|uniref:Ring-cleaving dioxygenase n=1 Tax=Mesobacillus maritimus TaxID=1643336 RepID=A0ABS7K0E5_9BACI|nr:ring-cleaving dioxygenase [Mesobacillus maritimus]MBY0095693.1 ring-cleaving dioxygenase [Mesobacillus maritimus]